MSNVVKSTARFAAHAMAVVATVSLIIGSILVAGSVLTAAFGGLVALPQLLGEMPFVIVATFLPALTYSFLMEFWYWRVQRRTFWAITGYSSFAFALAGIVGACTTDYIQSFIGRLILFSAGGALLGAFFGTADYFLFRTEKAPNSPLEPTRFGRGAS